MKISAVQSMQDIHLKWYIPVLCNIETNSHISEYFFSQHYTKVFDRLQKLGLSVSHKATILLISEVGKNHDQKVKEWQNNLMGTVEVSLKAEALL